MAAETSSIVPERDRAKRVGARRAHEVLRTEGVKGLALKLLARLCYRKVVLAERELRNLWLEPSTDVPIQVRRLRARDANAYADLRPDQDAGEALRRLADGHFCYVTWTNGRLSSAVWFQEGSAWIPELDRHLPLGPSEVYSYDSYTAPELRGRNIAPARGVQTTRLLRACGYERAIGFVLPENRASLTATKKIGVRAIGEMGYIQLGPVRIEFIRRGNEKRRWSVRRAPRLLLLRPAANPH
jgi:GNAT superfamily N-acetyltransferase